MDISWLVSKTQLFLCSLLLVVYGCGASKKSNEIFHSSTIDDFYKVHRLETNPEGEVTKSILILDAGVDNRVEKLYEELKKRDSDTNYRIIGLAHSKFSNSLRRRDFIPNSTDSFFCLDAKYLGEANLFRDFLINDFIPQYDSNADLRILVGHSFGGLFGVYMSLNDSTTFHRIISLSPSFWLNHRSFIANYSNDSTLTFKTPISMAYGSLEKLNFIGGSIKEFEQYLRSSDKNKITIEVMKGRTHIGIVKVIPQLL